MSKLCADVCKSERAGERVRTLGTNVEAMVGRFDIVRIIIILWSLMCQTSAAARTCAGRGAMRIGCQDDCVLFAAAAEALAEAAAAPL